MATKYLYLDDEADSVVRPFVRRVERAAQESGHELSIDFAHPLAFEAQVDAVSRSRKYDGYIFDLRLDQVATSDQDKVNFRATSLAQEVRTRATEGTKDMPLVLWSVNDRLKESYFGDNTSHDLFDLKCVKDEILIKEKAREIAVRLVDLAGGYKRIRELTKGKAPVEGLRRCLGLPREHSTVDSRIFSVFQSRYSPTPTHEFSRFIIKQLLEVTGPLIDENTLAARLGIDIHTSPDFAALKNGPLADIKYVGVLDMGWPRWWSGRLELWWRNLPTNPGSLRSINAIERVELLRKTFRLRRLNPAAPIEPEYSSNFWVVCRDTNRPLDPKNGIALLTSHTIPWQDREYISIAQALKGKHEEHNWLLDPLDKSRLKQAQKSVLSNTQKDSM